MPLQQFRHEALRHEALRHEALCYGSDGEFAGVLVPFIRDGLERGEAVTAAVSGHNTSLLRDALGTDVGAVTFADRDAWYLHPGTAMARCQQLLVRTARGHKRIRMIGEIGFGEAGRHAVWTRYEAVLNEVFAAIPALLLCPYDTRQLPASLLAEARRTHRAVHDPARRDSGSYLAAADFLRAVPEPMPEVAAPPALRLRLSGDLAAARQAIAMQLVAAGHAGWARREDLLLAASEIAANALQHGTGQRELRLWITGASVVCEVRDEGDGPADPFAGYRPPGPAIAAPRGLWLARQICDRLAIQAGSGGCRVAIALDL